MCVPLENGLFWALGLVCYYKDQDLLPLRSGEEAPRPLRGGSQRSIVLRPCPLSLEDGATGLWCTHLGLSNGPWRHVEWSLRGALGSLLLTPYGAWGLEHLQLGLHEQAST